MNGLDDLAVVVLEIDESDPEVRVAELSLDHVERDASASHLDRVRVTELVWREATANSDADTARSCSVLRAAGADTADFVSVR